MNKLATAVLAVAIAVAAGPAFGADQETKDAAAAERGKGGHESHQAEPAKKARKAKKDPNNTTKPIAPKTETKPTAEPSLSR